MNDQNTIPGWDDLKSAGQVPPPSPEVLAHARRQLETKASRRTTTRRRMVPIVAAAGAVAVAIGAVAVYQAKSSPTPVAGSTPSVQPSGPASTATSSASSGKPSQGSAASCVVGYSPAELKKRAFAFDGTVVKIVKDPGAAIPTYLLTFQVHEWFKPVGGGRSVTVRTITPPLGSGYYVSVEFPDYTVGTQLLITGEPQWGGTKPLKDAFAWGCGFSRAYNAADAATWRKILSK